MTVPFHPRPNDPDPDHLNKLLDAMRSGTRAPDAASPETPEAAALADAAGQLRGLVRRADAPAAAWLDDHPLHNRWEDIMSTAFPAAPPAAATSEAFAPSAPVSNRTRKMAGPPAENRLNAWLSAAIVALMLLGTVGGAWWLGPGDNGPSDDGRTRLAAVTRDEATPEPVWPTPLTPEEAPWIAAITPDQCTSEPMSYEEYAKAKTTDPGMPDRSYGIVGPATPEEAQEAVTVLRGWLACGDTGNESYVRPFYTDEFIFFQDFTVDNAPYRDDLDRTRAEVERQWTIWAEQTDLFPISVIEGVEPPDRARETWQYGQSVLDGEITDVVMFDSVTYFEPRFDPADAVMLEDGRIMIPTRYVYWAEDPWIQEYGFSSEPNVRTAAVILENVDGEWKIDESAIWICVGECDDVFTGTATPVAPPQAATGAPTKITDLLSAVPAEMPGQEEGPNVSWTYADVEQQLANMGFTPEEAVADPLQVVASEDFATIAWASNFFHFSTDEQFVAAIGFNPFTARQALGAFTFHDSLTVLRGDWDEDALITAWETAGYTPYTTEIGVTAWTIGPDGEVDSAHPIQGKVFSVLNNVAILDGGILVYAGTMQTLELALAAHAGEAESARDDARIAPMLATVPENTVSLVAFDQPGSVMFDLERQIEINPNIRPEDAEQMIEEIRAPLREFREAVGPMPDYHGVLFGITGGSGENGARVILRLGAESEEDAAQIATVVEWRWDAFLSQRSLRPLNTVMKVTDATSEGTTVMLAFDPLGNPLVWRDLLHANDLMPFAVDREDADASPVATPED